MNAGETLDSMLCGLIDDWNDSTEAAARLEKSGGLSPFETASLALNRTQANALVLIAQELRDTRHERDSEQRRRDSRSFGG